MASEPELKQTYAHIQASEEEMAGFRTGLGAKLASPPRRFTLFPKLAAPLLAAAACLVFLLPTGPRYDFSALTVEQIQALIADPQTSREDLREQAWAIYQHSGDAELRGTANAVLCLTLATDQALQQAVAGLVAEPRAEFRAFYLELILDEADDYRFNVERVEALMDQETDALCLRLYRNMLKLA